MANGYKITRSNYTLKQRHQTVSGGVVFERDFMTTTNLGPWDSGSIPYGENNFKMYYRALSNGKKNPYRGEWLKNECESGGSEYWTSECLPEPSTESENIKIKPNYNSLLDFAYYGSCTELVKSTITKIIKTFPAEMFVADGAEYGFENERILKNSFEINLTDQIVPDSENEMRYFLNSYLNYSVVINSTPGPITEVNVINEKDICDNFVIEVKVEGFGSGFISGVTYESGIHIVKTNFPVGTRIFPSTEYIDKFFEALDDFERVLLNVSTNPIYTAVLDTPRETEKGVESYQVSYTWPTENGWNVLIDGESFQTYINGLLSISSFYDEYYTNNLWRMLTHDSIKAMDLAYANPEKDEDTDDYNIGTTRLEGLFWAIGRQFDDIKCYIDNVKNTPKISYDGNNNVPNYFLTDSLALGGWEPQNIDSTLSKEDTTDNLFVGVSNGYNSEDANNVFLKNLRLNSRSIFAKKGTRQGIENILNLFGLMSYDMWRLLPEDSRPAYEDYRIYEYVDVVRPYSSDYKTIITGDTEEPLEIERSNMMKLSYDDSEHPEGAFVDTLQGIPCKVKYVETDDGVCKYVVPWFDKTKAYDGGLYFQSRGGWGLHEDTYNYGQVDELAVSGVGYGETVKYLVIVEKISDLRNIPSRKLYNGIIAYVSNIEYDIDATGVTITDRTSHYFVLKNKNYNYIIGDGTNGWNTITLQEVESDKKIYYIEHIVEEYLANNPHVGFGRYDRGEEFLAYIRMPLKYSIDKEIIDGEQMFDEGAYDCNGELNVERRLFDTTEYNDDMKCWYYEPLSENGNVFALVKDGNGYTEDTNKEPSTFDNSEKTTFERDLEVFDFISDTDTNSANEITCDSVVNVKNLLIVFNTKMAEKLEFENYLKTNILPYLSQMVPSDVISKYTIVGKAENEAVVNDTTPGINARDINAVTGENEINNDYIVNFPTDRGYETYIIDLDTN